VSLSASENQQLDTWVTQMRGDVARNYENLVKSGNPRGANTMQIAIIAYVAASVSSLEPENIKLLRENGILRI